MTNRRELTNCPWTNWILPPASNQSTHLEYPFINIKLTTSFLRFFNSFGRFIYFGCIYTFALDPYENEEILNSFVLVLYDILVQKGVAVHEPRNIPEEIFTCYQSLGWDVGSSLEVLKEDRLHRLLISPLSQEKERHCTNEVEILAQKVKEFNVPNQQVLLELEKINNWIPNNALKMSAFTEIDVGPVIDRFSMPICITLY